MKPEWAACKAKVGSTVLFITLAWDIVSLYINIINFMHFSETD